MKRIICALMALLAVILTASCAESRKYDIRITVPTGSTEPFVYSDEEISPLKKTFTVMSGEGLGDTEVILLPVEVREENAYDEATYITPGLPVKLKAEKGGWFKIGISMQNPTDEDITVYVTAYGVDVRT